MTESKITPLTIIGLLIIIGISVFVDLWVKYKFERGMMEKEYKGFIRLGYGECDETVCIETDDGKEPIAELIQNDIEEYGNFLTVRYFICDEMCSITQAESDLIKTITGSGKAEYLQHYSEATGYLWTDENLQVGGHDLKSELEYYDCSYLVLIVKYNKQLP